MNKDLVASSFDSHRIFSFLWNETLLDCIVDEIEMDFVPQEYVSFYQKRISLPLESIKKNNELDGLTARINLIFTSFEKKFNVDRAITEIDTSGARSAILITVEILDVDKRVVYSTKFNLGSKKAETISTNSEYMKRFSFLC